MENKPTLPHILRIVPLSIFTGWKILLPLVSFVVVFYANHYDWSQHNETGFTPTVATQGIVGGCYIVVWFAAALLTRVGYPTNWMWLKLLPISITRQLVIIFTEHLGLLLVWVILPVILLLEWIGQLQSQGWDVFFVCIGGNALFGLYITIFNLYARYTQGKPDLLLLPFLVATGLSTVCLFPFINELFEPPGRAFIIELPWDRKTVAILGWFITWSLAFISGWVPEKPLQRYRVKPHVKEVPPVLLQSEQISKLSAGDMSLRPFINVITMGVGYFFLAMALVVMEPHFLKITGYISDQKFLEQLFSNKLFSFMYHTGVMLVLISGLIFYIYFIGRSMMSIYYYGCLLRDCQMRPIETSSVIVRAWIQILVVSLVMLIVGLITSGKIPIGFCCFGIAMFLSAWTLATAWEFAAFGSPLSEEPTIRNLGLYEWLILLSVTFLYPILVFPMEHQYMNPMVKIPEILLAIGLNTATMYLMWKRY
jgi:hypothetical protein